MRWEVEKVRDREKRRELELSKMKSQNERMSQILENYQKELEHLKTANRKTLVDAQIQSAPKIDGSVLKQKDEIITKLRSELAISRIDIPEGKDLASENRKLQKIIIELEHGVGECLKRIIKISEKNLLTFRFYCLLLKKILFLVSDLNLGLNLGLEELVF